MNERDSFLPCSPPAASDPGHHSTADGAPPAVSVIVVSYRSEETLGACLEALRQQTYRDYEVVVVDSSPDDAAERLVREGFPEVRLVCSAVRLLPHAARNRGVVEGRGRVLVFLDPDVYAEPECLARMVAAHEEKDGQPVVGAIDCFGDRWLDVGIHLCKFSKWLPGGALRPVDMGPTASLLVDRGAYEEVGGFRGDHFLADALFSWRLLVAGRTLWFEPRAVVAHHHLSDLRGFVRERYKRGILFGNLRAEWSRHSWGRNLLFLVASLFLLRMPRILALMLGQGWRAGQTGRFLATLPLSAVGHVASLLGEGVADLGLVLHPRSARSGAQSGTPAPEVEAGATQ